MGIGTPMKAGSGAAAMRENTAERWGSVQIGLHWTIAALVLLVQVPAGIGASP
jgi:hypothetical protein